jgi:hypothetical protein
MVSAGGWSHILVDEFGDLHHPDFIAGEVIESGKGLAISEVVDALPGGSRAQECFDGLSVLPGAGAFKAVTKP